MRLIRGAAGSGKTALVFQEFKEALKQNRAGARIVVPTATLVRHFQHELARDGIVFPPSAIVSFSRFARDLTPQLKQVPDTLLRVIVRDALSRLKLREFEQVAATEGMVSTVLDTIGLFDNAGASVEKLAGVKRLSPYGRAFEKLWREIERTVHRCGYAMRSEILRAAALNLPPLKIWMDGFLAFSPIEKEFVRELAARCSLTMTLGDARGFDDLYRFVLQIGGEHRSLHGPGRKAPIVGVAAPSMERECDEIARRIIEARDGGTSFREIGVALRDAASYLSLIRCTLDRFGIPARYYFSTPLRTHPVAQFLSGLIVNTLEGWEFGFALQTLRAHPALGLSAAFDRFDFKVREAIPGRGAAELASLCEKELAEKIWLCFVADGWRDHALTPAAWNSRLRQWAENLYRPGMLDAPRRFTEVESARTQVAGLRAWLEAVEAAASLFGPEAQPVSLEEFWRVAGQAVEGAVVQSSDDRADVVHVMSAHEARQWDVRTLFVCGLTHRDFPGKTPQNLLFPDSEIEVLRKAGIHLRKTSELASEERDLFECLKTRARESLVLTWPSHDAAGKSVQASEFIRDLNVTPVAPRLCRPMHPEAIAGKGITGLVESPELKSWMEARHQKIAITALEDLAQCRFKFFAGRTLGLKPPPIQPHERLSTRVNGLILHKALEAWLNAKREGSFSQVFETAFDDYCREEHVPPGYRVEVERIFLREIAARVSATERWTPLSSEPEVELSIAFPKGVTVIGRVDRIDRMSDTECIIVDYKSGKRQGVEKLVGSKVKLQGPLYALAAKETLNLDTLAMMYVAVREDKVFGWGEVPGADLKLAEMPARWMEDARDRAVERLTGLLEGAVHAEPAELEQCRWCDFAAACRYSASAALTEAAHGD